MYPSSYKRGALWLLLTALSLTTATAQDRTVFEAPLIQGETSPIRNGAVVAILEGQDLNLFVSYFRLGSYVTGFDLFRGHPNNGGEQVKSLGIQVPNPHALGGGLDVTTALTEADVEDLHAGNLYLVVHTINPSHRLSGQLQPTPAAEPEFTETRLWQAFPLARGRVRGMVTPEGLRLMGFFHGLGSNWGRIGLYRGAHGTEGELVASVDNYTGELGLFYGFDQTFQLEAGWEDDLRRGLYYVKVHTIRPIDVLRGQLRPSANEAPPPSQIVEPPHGDIIVIGGEEGGEAEDPAVYLGMISFTKVEDPDGDPIAYHWQVSVREDFYGPTITFDLGVDSTRIPLTVGRAAALVDSLARMQGGDIQLHTPLTVYHRVYTTDGSYFTAGETRQVTFMRGTVTSADPDPETPEAFTLHGNYPNPFNPSTTVVVDLPAAAHVSLDVFDLTGRRVLALPEQALPAGRQRLHVDGSGLASGGYLYRIKARTATGVVVAGGKMMLVK